MNTTKVREALEDLMRQRSVVDEAMIGLQRVLALLESGESVSKLGQLGVSVPVRPKTYIDETEALLRTSGRPLHIKIITDKIGEQRGKEIPRASIESSLISHMKNAAKPRVVRVGPGLWGLPSWHVVSEPEAEAA